MDGFEDEPIVRGEAELCRCNGQTKLEGHVEAGSCGRSAIQLDPRQIVNRITATADQIEDFVQAVLPTGNFNGGMGIESQMDQACNVGEIEAAELPVIRNVEKNGIFGAFRRLCAHEILSFSKRRMPLLYRS